MKFLLLLAAAVCLASAQRPFYAGRRTYPQVLPQYLKERDTLVLPNNRIDGISPSSTSSTTSTTTASPDQPSDENSIDNSEDEYIKMIKTWPREKWPFWYLNAKQIEEHLGSASGGQPTPNHKPFYAG